MIGLDLIEGEEEIQVAILETFREDFPDHVADEEVYRAANRRFPMNPSVFYLFVGILAGRRLLLPTDPRQEAQRTIDYRWRAIPHEEESPPPGAL